MPSTDTLPPPSLQSVLLHLVNEILPALRLSHTEWQPVAVDTPLFENGRIDSLAILHLIGTIEDYTGQPVPDHLVSMKHFHNIATVVATFAIPTHDSGTH